MANPLEGEVAVVIAGKTYTLCFPTRSVVQIEQLFDNESIGEIASKMMHFEYLAAMAWASLQKHHSEIDLLATYDLLDKFEGGVQAIGEPIARALRFRISGAAVDSPLVAEEGGDA